MEDKPSKRTAGYKFTHKTEAEKNKKRVIVVLENAYLETVKSKKTDGAYELLNCDDHIHTLKKLNRDFSEARPDITHQCLLTLLDSPLNKAGLLQVFIKTRKGVLIEINPQTRIPRTFKRFCGLMVQLLHELKINSVQAEGTQTLLKVIKNPVTDYFPTGARRIGTTSDASKLVNLNEFVHSLDANKPVVFVVGAMSKGSDEIDYAEQYVCFSNYPLSASVACSKITNAFEQLWGIL